MIATNREPFWERYRQKLPTLFLVWIVLSTISPHPDLFKGWFHLTMGIPLVVMLALGQLRINTTDSMWRVCLALLLYTATSSLIVSHADWGQHLHALRWSLETLMLLLALFFALPPLLNNPLFLGRLLLTCTILGSLSALMVFGISQGFSHRLTGIGALYQPIEGASVLIMYLSMGAFLLWQKRHKLTWKDQTLLFSALILTCTCTLLSGSRGPTLALLLVVGYCLLVGAIVHRHWIMLLTTAACLITALIGVLWFYGFDHFINGMLERGASHRLLLWSTHFQHPPDSLLFGHGAATNLKTTVAGLKIHAQSGLDTGQPHNLFIGAFVQTGLVGLGLLLLLLATLLRGIYRACTSTAAKWYMLGIFGLVIMLVTTNTYTIIISAKAIWLYTWFPLIFLWLWAQQARRPETSVP